MKTAEGVTKTYAGGDEHGAELCADTTAHPTVFGTVAKAKLTARVCAHDSGRTTSAPSVCLSNALHERLAKGEM